VSQPLEDGRLTAYLLGRLSPEEEETVETEYLGEVDAYERLQAAEDDLIDAYVAGRLPADDVRRFEERFRAPARRERVAFARALRQLVEQKAERPPSRRASLLLPLAAAVPLALAGWLFVTMRELRTELTRQREQQAVRERDSALDRARIASLEQELASPRPAAGVVTWRLDPGFERDGPPSARLTVPADAAEVRLQLSLSPGAGNGPFVARVESAEGHLVAELHGLRSREDDASKVDVVVPAASLPPGTYVVILRDGRPPEVVDTYRLRVGPSPHP
jgi:hypothetical protein